MAKNKTDGDRARRTRRTFPFHSLQEALSIPQKIRDESGSNPMNRLLLGDALGVSPASSNFRDLLSSSYKYGLTEGTEKATDISLTEIGKLATGSDDAARPHALRKAAQEPTLFKQFYEKYDQAKVPSTEMLPKILGQQFDVPDVHAAECARLLVLNGRWVGVIRDLTGGQRVMLDAAPLPTDESEAVAPTLEPGADSAVVGGEPAIENLVAADGNEVANAAPPANVVEEARSKILFVGHGKKRGPLEKVEKFLVTYGIPYKIAVDEPNLGRPIPTKVKDVMRQCGAAILILTKDEVFQDLDGNEIWRPSENVVYELGAASLLYDDRIVIFMEDGLHFPMNFESIGHIEFEEDQIEAKTSDLLQELIGFGLIKITVS